MTGKKINRNRQEMVDDRMVKIVITDNMSDVQNKKQKTTTKKEESRSLEGETQKRLRKTQMELLKIKNIMYEVKNTLDRINKKLDTSGEKANELEDIATETNLEDRGKKRQRKNKTEHQSACCGTVSGGLTHN